MYENIYGLSCVENQVLAQLRKNGMDISVLYAASSNISFENLFYEMVIKGTKPEYFSLLPKIQDILKETGVINLELKNSYILTDDGIKKVAEEQPETEDLSDVALIMCTSGTTGNPKGAMITEANLLTNIKDIDNYFDIKTRNNILISRPLYHCAVLTGEFFISLVKGLNVYFLNESYNPAVIIDAVERNSIDVMCGTPSLFYHICRLLTKKAKTIFTIICNSMQRRMYDRNSCERNAYLLP